MPIANHVSCQIVLQNINNLPRDSTTMTLHFRKASGSTFAAWVTSMSPYIVNNFNVAPTPATTTIAAYINDQMSRVTNASSLKWYDLSTLPPHVPTTVPWTLGASGDTISLPNEVSLCGSFRGAVVPGVPRARQRGRIYVGPLNLKAFAATEAGGDQRPGAGTGAIIDAIRYGLKNIAVSAITEGGSMVVYSPTSELLTDVNTIWVDDAFDTQRRRGARAVNRYTLAVV